MPTSKRGVFTRMLAFVAAIFATTTLPVHAGPAGPLPASPQPLAAEANEPEINIDEEIAIVEPQADTGSEHGLIATVAVPPSPNYYLSARLCSVARLNTPVVNGARRKTNRSGTPEKAMPKRVAKKQSAKRSIKVQPSWQRPSANHAARINTRPSAVILNLPVRNRGASQTARWSSAA